jgi:hypothetical protein
MYHKSFLEYQLMPVLYTNPSSTANTDPCPCLLAEHQKEDVLTATLQAAEQQAAAMYIIALLEAPSDNPLVKHSTHCHIPDCLP